MEIRKRGSRTMNREEGTFLLSHVYDPLLTISGNTGCGNTTSAKAVNGNTMKNRQSGSFLKPSDVKVKY